MAYSSSSYQSQSQLKQQREEEKQRALDTIRNLYSDRIKLVEEYREEYKIKAKKSKSTSDMLRFSSTVLSFAAPALVALQSATSDVFFRLFTIVVTAFAVTSGTLLNVFNLRDRFAGYRLTELQLEKLKNRAETNMELILIKELTDETVQEASTLLKAISINLEEIVENQVEKELELFTLDDDKSKKSQEDTIQEDTQTANPQLDAN